MHLAAAGPLLGEKLDLSGLGLTNMPSLDGIDFRHVTALDLSNNKLIIATHLKPFKHITSLDLSRNELIDLPYDLREMHGLTHLNLEKNRITIDKYTSPLPLKLEVVVLNDNLIKERLNLSPLLFLRKLGLARTGLTQWPEGVNEAAFLEILDLRSNRLTEIADSIISPSQDQLVRSGMLSNKIYVRDNPLSAATLEKLRLYLVRLRIAGFTDARPQTLLSEIAAPLPPQQPKDARHLRGHKPSLDLQQPCLTGLLDDCSRMSIHDRQNTQGPVRALRSKIPENKYLVG